MGSAFVVSDTTLNKRLPRPLPIAVCPVAFEFLPVYTPDNELMYHAPITRVQHLIETGKVRPRGTKHRVLALIATSDVDSLMSLLLSLAKPKAGTKFSHIGETDENPRGVWTFAKSSYA